MLKREGVRGISDIGTQKSKGVYARFLCTYTGDPMRVAASAEMHGVESG